jgi:hypothetical protein
VAKPWPVQPCRRAAGSCGAVVWPVEEPVAHCGLLPLARPGFDMSRRADRAVDGGRCHLGGACIGLKLLNTAGATRSTCHFLILTGPLAWSDTDRTTPPDAASASRLHDAPEIGGFEVPAMRALLAYVRHDERARRGQHSDRTPDTRTTRTGWVDLWHWFEMAEETVTVPYCGNRAVAKSVDLTAAGGPFSRRRLSLDVVFAPDCHLLGTSDAIHRSSRHAGSGHNGSP